MSDVVCPRSKMDEKEDWPKKAGGYNCTSLRFVFFPDYKARRRNTSLCINKILGFIKILIRVYDLRKRRLAKRSVCGCSLTTRLFVGTNNQTKINVMFLDHIERCCTKIKNLT